MGELKGFVEGATSAERFRELGCKFWDRDANENGNWLTNQHRKGKDDLGRIYGVQWRSFGDQVDQLQNVVRQMTLNPDSRRIVCMAWNPFDVDKCAVPPCHMGFHIILNPATREADLVMWMRSADLLLGVPCNMMSYAALLHCLCYISGNWAPREVIINMDDCHVYSSHFTQVKEQLLRPVYDLPTLGMSPPPRSIDAIASTQFELVNYFSGSAIAAPMETTPIT
jgi:thymidylate synthase